MHKFTNTLTPTQVYRFAVDFCQPHLGFRTLGKVTAEVFLTVLFAAAVRISSVFETCRRLSNVPCENTFAPTLYANLPALEELKRRINAAFERHLEPRKN